MKKPNQLGLYDCCGNVWEWCYDTTNSGYISNKMPYIYDETDNTRRLRGGSWVTSQRNYSIFKQNRADALKNYNFYGFRIVRTI